MAWTWLDKWYMLPKIIMTVLGVYVICSAMEIIRWMLFRPIERSKKLQGFYGKIDRKLSNIWKGVD